MQETAILVSAATRLEGVYRQHGARLWRAVFALSSILPLERVVAGRIGR
jgi:hypothetical protein